MFPKIAVVSKAIASLFDSTCEVYTYKKTADFYTHETTMKKVNVGKAACRVNVESAPAATAEGVAPAGVSQLITLIMEPDISVPEGACVDITFSDGTVRRYISAGVTARYAHHQEIALELREEHP